MSNNIGYDVRCYHQPSGTYSEPYWWWNFGSTYLPQAFGSSSSAREKRKPTSVTFEGFPNPFNPSTKLMYSLKDDSNVDFRVYDLREGLSLKSLPAFSTLGTTATNGMRRISPPEFILRGLLFSQSTIRQ